MSSLLSKRHKEPRRLPKRNAETERRLLWSLGFAYENHGDLSSKSLNCPLVEQKNPLEGCSALINFDLDFLVHLNCLTTMFASDKHFTAVRSNSFLNIEAHSWMLFLEPRIFVVDQSFFGKGSFLTDHNSHRGRFATCIGSKSQLELLDVGKKDTPCRCVKDEGFWNFLEKRFSREAEFFFVWFMKVGDSCQATPKHQMLEFWELLKKFQTTKLPNSSTSSSGRLLLLMDQKSCTTWDV